MDTTTEAAAPEARPLWRRRGVWIAALVFALPALAIAWYLGSPLFLDTTVVEEFPAAAAGESALAATPADDLAGATAEPALLLAGAFEDADASHRGSGSAAIYTLEDGSRVLRFEDLDVTNGPDLHVILSPTGAVDNRDDVMAPGYVDLGSLKGNKGDQNYEIPADVDLSGDVTIVIYCQPFHVVFSTTALA